MSSTESQGQRLSSTTAFGAVLTGVAGFLLLWSGVIILLLLTRSRAVLTPMVLASFGLSLGIRVGLLVTGLALLLRSAFASGAAMATLAGAAAAFVLNARMLLLNPTPVNGQRAFRIGAAAGAFGILILIAGLAAGALLYLRRPQVAAEFAEGRPGPGL